MSTSWAVGRLRLFLVACLLISPSGCMTAGLWETALDCRAGVGRTEELTLVGFSLDARGCLVMRAENRDGLEQQFILGAGPEDEHARALVWSGAARDCSIRLDLWATEGASGTGTLELGGELVRPVRVLQAALASPVGEPAVLPPGLHLHGNTWFGGVTAVPDTPLWFRPVAWLLDGQPVDDEVVAAAFGGQPADLGRLRGFELCVVVRVGVSAPKHVGFAVRGDALWIDRYARVTQREDRFCWDYDTEVSAGRAESGSNSGPITPVSGDTRVTVVWFHRRSRGLRIAGAVLLMPLAVAADAVGAAVVVSLLFVVGSLPCDDDDDDDR